MILKVPERTPQKVKLRNTVSTLGTSFRDPFADLFGKMLTKRESQNEARIQAARAPFDMILRCDVFARKRTLLGLDLVDTTCLNVVLDSPSQPV